MNSNVLLAIFKRNFSSYFANPTGYVFICVFVMACSIAAIWPHEFFNNNLANLDQLTFYLPFILIGFIPAVTMSLWAEERRQGTDELLLTIPATDLDVVVGKFLAAVGIYSVSLAFSMMANLLVISQLGSPDLGLFFGTYVGYWLVGVTMISVGMVASFLTSNLTVGFVLGVVFNLPLVLPALADFILPPTLADLVRPWSVAEQFRNFERGVISLAGISFFAMITVVMLYLSVVLIGRRHWLGGRDGNSLIGHYVIRTVALVIIAMGLTVFLTHHDLLRLDVTSARLSSLSPDTIKILEKLDRDGPPVVVEAYISPEVPKEYAQTRLNLISMLDEMSALSDGRVHVDKHFVENFSPEAAQAEEKYGIKAETVRSKDRGAQTEKDIYLGVVASCGLDRVVVPFINKGIPVEYELIRSIATVAQQERKKVGVLKTDAPLLGGFNPQTFQPTADSPLIVELRKQYDVVEVDPSRPINDRYDVMLAVQPSSLGPEQMTHFIDAVKAGQPTVIFEDPLPVMFAGTVPGTSQPKQSQQMMMMGGGRPQPKGDIKPLFDFLGVDFVKDQVIWQDYNPYPKFAQDMSQEFIFIGPGSGATEPFNPNEAITSRLSEVLFLFAGSWRRLPTSDLEFTDLARTNVVTGSTDVDRIVSARYDQRQFARDRLPTEEQYVVAARVRGKVKREVPPENHEQTAGDPSAAKSGGNGGGDDQTSEENDKADVDAQDKEVVKGDAAIAEDTNKKNDKTIDKSKSEPEEVNIDVVLVSDIDCLAPAIFQLREIGRDEDVGIEFNFQNVAFVLNALDVLADDEHPYVEIRKRRREHRTLTKFEASTENARTKANQQRQEYYDKYDRAIAKAQATLREKVEAISKRTDLDDVSKAQQAALVRQQEQRKLNIAESELAAERDRELKKIDRELSGSIRGAQDRFKLWAALLPPVAPILVGCFVFFQRRSMEHEGVAKSRMR